MRIHVISRARIKCIALIPMHRHAAAQFLFSGCGTFAAMRAPDPGVPSWACGRYMPALVRNYDELSLTGRLCVLACELAAWQHRRPRHRTF